MARTRPMLPLLRASAQKRVHTPARGAFARNAYEDIRQAILDCTLLPGVALSEQALSENLGVSRAPVRDALRQLASEELIQVVPQRGTYVSLIDPSKVRDAVFVREVIECQAAELACQAPLGERKALSKMLIRQKQAINKGDFAAHLQADEELHQRILQIAGHPHAWPALRLARTGMNRIRHLAIAAVGSHRIAAHQHAKIIEAILAGDASSAREQMREHIRAPLGFLGVIARNHPNFLAQECHEKLK